MCDVIYHKDSIPTLLVVKDVDTFDILEPDGLIQSHFVCIDATIGI